jgi:large subunit ribosomal protein L25
METVIINGQARSERGRKAATTLRRQGLVPCNLYGGKENLTFSVPATELRPLIYTPAFKLAELNVDGKKLKAIVKEMQFHPVKDSVIHVDFQELVDDVKVKVNVPLRLEGTPAAVSMGGKLEQTMRKLTVMALPKDLPTEVVLNVADMDFNDVKRVRDVKIEGVTFMHAPAIPIARVATSRAAKEAQAAAAAAAAADTKKK